MGKSTVRLVMVSWLEVFHSLRECGTRPRRYYRKFRGAGSVVQEPDDSQIDSSIAPIKCLPLNGKEARNNYYLITHKQQMTIYSTKVAR